jgi:phosphoglycolate phosphatase
MRRSRRPLRLAARHASDGPMDMSPSLPTIVFDLDGTLADTAEDLVATLNLILVREGLEAIPASSARELIGYGSRALLQRGFAVQGRTVTPSRLETLFEDFLAHYGSHLADATRLFPGVEAALDRLSQKGHRLAVCTNKHEKLSRELLGALGVASRFQAICGRDTFTFCKPDPRHLTETVLLAGGSAAAAIMVGDSKTDIDTARAAELPVIAVPFGYTDIPVAELAPDSIIDHFDEIDAAIDKLIGRMAAFDRPRP